MLEPPSSDSEGSPLDFFELFSPARLLVLCLALLFTSIFLQVGIESVVGGYFPASILTGGLLLVAFPVWLVRRAGFGASETFRLYPLDTSHLLWLTLLTLALLLPMEQLTRWNTEWVQIPEWVTEAMAELRPEGALEWMLAVLAACVVGPIGEELIFRGLLQQSAERNMSGVRAAVLCGIFFAVVHLQPYYLMGLGLLGIALGLVFWITDSLWATIYVHALYNGASLTLMALDEAEYEGVLEGPGTLALLALASLALAVLALWRLAETSRLKQPTSKTG